VDPSLEVQIFNCLLCNCSFALLIAEDGSIGAGGAADASTGLSG
jgi:hypothetical protein